MSARVTRERNVVECGETSASRKREGKKQGRRRSKEEGEFLSIGTERRTREEQGNIRKGGRDKSKTI